MVLAAMMFVIIALVALEQTVRIAWEDSGPWRRGRFVAYALILLAAAFAA